MNPTFQIVIVLYDSADAVGLCLDSLRRLHYDEYRITVLDNASKDGGAMYVEQSYPWARVIRSDYNRGFAGGNNRAAEAWPQSDFLLLLNPDVEIDPDALIYLAAAFAREPRLGVAGFKLLAPDGRTIQHVGGTIDPNGLTHHIGEGEIDRGQYAGILPCPYVQGAAFAVRRKAWSELGGFDDGFFPAYFEEADFCTRARKAGWEVAVVAEAAAIHHQDPVRQVHDWRFLRMLFRGRARYLIKHYRPRDWIFQFWPAEIRWLLSRDSKRYRRIALQALWETAMGVPPREL
jgi:GT2 family glycosyltransferase